MSEKEKELIFEAGAGIKISESDNKVSWPNLLTIRMPRYTAIHMITSLVTQLERGSNGSLSHYLVGELKHEEIS